MNPLQDVLTPAIRKYAYAVLFVASLVFAVYQASDGDWGAFVGGLVTALLGATAASNVSGAKKPTVDADAFAKQSAELKAANDATKAVLARIDDSLDRLNAGKRKKD